MINIFSSNKVALRKEPMAVQKTDVDLHQLLMDLAQWGEVSMHLLRSGWTCKLELHVELLGTSVDVRSEFNHKDPTAAALQCQERAIALRKTQGVQQ